MKRFIITSILLFFSLLIFCQEKKSNNIYVEFFGASNLFGVSYDTRIKPDSKLGYRVGISYAYSGSSFMLIDNSASIKGVTFPLEMNYLIGSKRHKFEIGLGANLGIYRSDYSYTFYDYTMVEKTGIPSTIGLKGSKKSFGYYLYSNIGYRYQRPKGFLFRAGFSPSFNFGDDHGIKKQPLLYPYLSFGYSF